MAFEFVPAWDARTQFTCEIPTKDGKSKTFSVPRMEFIDDETYATFAKWFKDNPDDKLLEDGRRPVSEAFDFFITELGIDDAQWFVDNVVFGEKVQLWNEWNRLTDVPLGES